MGTMLPQMIRPRVQTQVMHAQLLLRISSPHNQGVVAPFMASNPTGLVSYGPLRYFATKKDDGNSGEDPPVKKRRGRPPKVRPEAVEEGAVEATAAKRTRATRAKKLDVAAAEEETKAAPVKRTRKTKKA